MESDEIYNKCFDERKYRILCLLHYATDVHFNTLDEAFGKTIYGCFNLGLTDMQVMAVLFGQMYRIARDAGGPDRTRGMGRRHRIRTRSTP